MPFRIGPTELIIILVIVMIVFGVGRLPEIGGALGKSIRSFKRSVTGDDEKAETVNSTEEKTESKA
jgi:sec-independent protein translocase protein TatA